MKKLFYLLAVIVISFACNSGSGKNDEDVHATHETAADTALSLNNGARWNADSVTTHNVVNMKTIADNFRIKPFPSLTDYQLLGADLSNGVNKLIKDCKMSGRDHDELHKWLEPVLKESNNLKTVADTATGRNLFRSLDGRIDAYNNYFQ